MKAACGNPLRCLITLLHRNLVKPGTEDKSKPSGTNPRAKRGKRSNRHAAFFELP